MWRMNYDYRTHVPKIKDIENVGQIKCKTNQLKDNDQ